MEPSAFLAKVLGIYLIVICLLMLVHRKRFLEISALMIAQPALLAFAAIISLIIGILLIVSHNLWIGDWRIIITLIAWLIFIRSIVSLFITGLSAKLINLVKKETVYYPVGIIFLLIGCFLLYQGFFANM